MATNNPIYKSDTSGEPVDVFLAGAPEPATLIGRYVVLEPLGGNHAQSLYEALDKEDQGELQRYTSDPICNDEADAAALIASKHDTGSGQYFACVDHFSGKAKGFAGLLRADRENRVIELGNLLFTSALACHRSGTEAVYLLMRHAFEDLGYRRLEWKCNSLNQRSHNAALRYGFSFEGIFRQHMIVKGTNRDTAWFSLTDQEWPQRRAAFEAWLQTSNFDAAGQQFTSLSELNGVGSA